jgi:multidrug efflux pump subunit AcrB
VLENIHRHLKMGKTPRQAAIDGRTEIGQAAMAITMVDVVVFVPIAFMGGIVGQMFRQFGIVVATATLFSLFISFTLTPMLASRWLKAHAQEEEDEAREAAKPGLFTRFVRAWEAGYNAVDGFYRFLLNWALHHHSAVICLGVMTMVGSFAISMVKPSAPVFLKALPVLLVGWLIVTVLWYVVRITTRRWARIVLGLVAGVLSVAVIIGVSMGIGKSLAAADKGALSFLVVTGILGTLTIIGYMLHLEHQGDERVSTPAPALLMGAAVLFTLAYIVPGHFGFEFAPTVDRRQFSIKIEREVGTSLPSTDRTVAEIEKALFDPQQYPETKTVFTTVGGTSSSIFTGNSAAADTAQISIELKDRTGSTLDRILGQLKEEVGNRSTDGVIQAINTQFAHVPGAKITASSAAGFGGSEAPIQIEVSGQQMARTQRVASQVLEIVQQTEGTYSCELSWREGRPEMQAMIDRDRAAQYGVSVAQIATALRTSLQGDTTVKYRESGREYDIRVQLPEGQRDATGKLANMVVATSSAGRPVYLYEVVHLDPAAGPTKLERTNRQRTITVKGQIASGHTLGVVQGLINAKVRGVDQSGVNIVWAGQAERMRESGQDLFSALGLSVLLVFMLMAALFESLLSPLIIMMAVPQAMAGAIFALTLTNKTLSIVTMIGIIMLVGLVTKNAILLVDYTNTLRQEFGKSVREALLQSGPTRLRPILMTTLAMIFGMLPTALALAKGSEMRQPMAIAVIGGLALSMFLTLLMVPVFYEIFDSASQWITSVKNRVLGMFSR